MQYSCSDLYQKAQWRCRRWTWKRYVMCCLLRSSAVDSLGGQSFISFWRWASLVGAWSVHLIITRPQINRYRVGSGQNPKWIKLNKTFAGSTMLHPTWNMIVYVPILCHCVFKMNDENFSCSSKKKSQETDTYIYIKKNKKNNTLSVGKIYWWRQGCQ